MTLIFPSKVTLFEVVNIDIYLNISEENSFLCFMKGVGKLTGETFCRISDKLLYWNPYGMLCIWLANLSEKISDKMLHEIPRRLTFKLLDQASKLELVWHIFTDLTSNFIGSWASVGVKPYQSEIYELNKVCNPPEKDLDRCHHVTVVFFQQLEFSIISAWNSFWLLWFHFAPFWRETRFIYSFVLNFIE